MLMGVALAFALLVSIVAIQNSMVVPVQFLAWRLEASLVVVIIGSALAGAIIVDSVSPFKQVMAKPYFVRDGYFQGVDAAFHAHVSSDLATSYGVRQYAIMSVEYEFYGKTAHSGVSPWTGISALDAVKLLDVGWDVLREHLPPTQPSHCVILNAGTQPNVVPDYAKIWYYFREADYDGMYNLYTKAKNVAQGVALMIGCTWKENVLSACWPTRDNETMAEIVQSNIDMVGMPVWTDEEQALARGINGRLGPKRSV